MADGDYYVNGIKVRADGAVYTTTTANMALLAASSGSSLVGFIQNGTGAVADTVQAALRRFVHTAQFSTQGNYETARDALTGTIGVPSIDVAGVLTVTDTVPHFIGTTVVSPDLTCHLTVGKKTTVFSDGADGPCGGIMYQGLLAPGINDQGYGIVSAPYFNTQASGTHGAIVGIEADAPVISTAGGATVTETSAIRVGAGVGAFIAGISDNSQFAIKIEWGVCKFKGVPGDVDLPACLIPNNTYISWKDSTDAFTNAGFVGVDGSNRLAFGAGNNTRMYVSSGGLILIGTTVTTNGAAGELVFANNKSVRGVNAAGTGTILAVKINSADRIELGTTTNDVQFMPTLVALGAGGAATLGLTGGTGPATTTQNTWMRWVDSNGNTFWVPVWK